MFKHILVPTDLTATRSHSLDVAVKMALLDKGRITLVHVIETIADTTFEEYQGFYKKLEEKAHQAMDALIHRYDGSAVEIHSRISYGDRVREILELASKNNVDLIVIDSHRIDLKEPFSGWGTISYKIGVLAQCPVLLVK